ncbi:MAG: YciI family protein [Roseobacter sp.]
MVAWSDYKAEAKSRGALALELYAATSTPAKKPEDVKASLSDHLAYQAELERAGSLAFAGPMSDETGDHMQGMGLIIYRAENFEAALALAKADPMHKSGARNFILRRWMINEGSLTLSVGLSTAKALMS